MPTETKNNTLPQFFTYLHTKAVRKGADIIYNLIINFLFSFIMLHLKVSTEFAKYFSPKNVGSSIKMPNGDVLELVAYFPSQKDRDGNFKSGRQTAVDYKKDGKFYEDVSTEILKDKYFPDREKQPHGSKTAKFRLANLHLATDEELQKLISDASALLQERAEKAKAEKAKEKARKAALAKLTAAERAALGL